MANKFREKAAGFLYKRLAKSVLGSAGSMPLGWLNFLTGRDFQLDIATVFKSWTYVCIDKRANALTGLKWKVRRRTAQDQAQDLPLNHWGVEMLNDPSEHFVRSEIFSLIEQWYCYHGNTFIWTPLFPGERVPRRMWVLPSNLVDIVPGRTAGEFIHGYTFRASGQTIPIDKKEIIHIRKLQPSYSTRGQYYGVGLADAAADAIASDRELNGYLKRYLQNDGTSPLTAMTDDAMKPDDWERLKAKFREEMPHLRLVALLEGGLKLAPLNQNGTGGVSGTGGGSSVAMALNPLLKEDICAVFGMSSQIITMNNTSYLNADAVDYQFFTKTMQPHAKYIGEVITKHYQQFEDNIVVEPEEYVRQDPNFELEEKTKLGFVPNVELKRRGMKPVPGGDIFIIPGGYTTLEAIQAQAEAMSGPAPEGDDTTTEEEGPDTIFSYEGEDDGNDAAVEMAFDTTDAEQKRFAAWKGWSDFRREHEAVLTRDLKHLFRELGEEIDGRLSKRVIAPWNRRVRWPHPESEAKADGELSSESLFDYKKWVLKFRKTATPDVRDMVLETAERAASQVAARWDEIESDYDRDLAKRVEESVKKIADEPLKTVTEELRKLLKKNADKTANELREIISERFSEVYSKSRIDNIARTTATFALNSTQSTIWTGLGMELAWLSARTANVRAAHREADGQKQGDDGKFLVGGEKLEHPGTGSPRNACRCQCTLFPEEA